MVNAPLEGKSMLDITISNKVKNLKPVTSVGKHLCSLQPPLGTDVVITGPGTTPYPHGICTSESTGSSSRKSVCTCTNGFSCDKWNLFGRDELQCGLLWHGCTCYIGTPSLPKNKRTHTGRDSCKTLQLSALITRQLLSFHQMTRTFINIFHPSIDISR